MSDCKHEDVYESKSGYACCKCEEWMKPAHYIGLIQSELKDAREQSEHYKTEINKMWKQKQTLDCEIESLNTDIEHRKVEKVSYLKQIESLKQAELTDVPKPT